jgi:proteic killer suppression protein
VHAVPGDARATSILIELCALRCVRDLRELAIPPGNRLEALSGSRKGQHSIRVNQQYRVCFRWEAGYADEVEVTDYH